jgi:hypothetical protein
MAAMVEKTAISSVTPNKDQYFARLHAVENSVANCDGSILIVGIKSLDDEDEDKEDEEDAEDGKDYTDEQLSGLRHIIMTVNREKCFERMEKIVDPQDGFFNTSTGMR